MPAFDRPPSGFRRRRSVLRLACAAARRLRARPFQFFLLRAMGLPRDCARLAPKKIESAPCLEVESEIGSRRYDTLHSAARRSSLKMFEPTGRAIGPTYRLLLRARASQVGAIPAAWGNPGAAGGAFETTLRVIPLPVSAEPRPGRRGRK